MKYRGLLQLAALAVMVIVFLLSGRLTESFGGWGAIFGALGLAYLLAAVGDTTKKSRPRKYQFRERQ